MKTTTESKLRRIIREELDYYFSRIENMISESSNSPSAKILEEVPKTTANVERKNFRKKFSGLMGAITEDIDTNITDLDSQRSNSILDDGILDSLESNRKTQAIHKALTKDYSALLKKIESK